LTEAQTSAAVDLRAESVRVILGLSSRSLTVEEIHRGAFNSDVRPICASARTGCGPSAEEFRPTGYTERRASGGSRVAALSPLV
jgi:hypothetical protein